MSGRRLDLHAWAVLPDSIRQHPPTAQALLAILGVVALEPTEQRLGRKRVKLRPGQFVLGRSDLAQAAGLTSKQARTALERLEQAGLIGPADPKWSRRDLLAFEPLLQPGPAPEPEGRPTERPSGPPPWRRLVELFADGAGRNFLAPPEKPERVVIIRLNQLARKLKGEQVTEGDIRGAGRIVAGFPHPVGVSWLMRSPNLWDAIQRHRAARQQPERHRQSGQDVARDLGVG